MVEKKEDKLDKIIIKLNEHDEKLSEHDIKFDKIFDKLTEHDKRFDKMEQKMNEKFGEMSTGLDKIINELEKAREDRVFARAKDRDQDRMIEDIDKRVKVLEESRI